MEILQLTRLSVLKSQYIWQILAKLSESEISQPTSGRRCEIGDVKCRNGMCITREALCDGVKDCDDDERLAITSLGLQRQRPFIIFKSRYKGIVQIFSICICNNSYRVNEAARQSITSLGTFINVIISFSNKHSGQIVTNIGIFMYLFQNI